MIKNKINLTLKQKNYTQLLNNCPMKEMNIDKKPLFLNKIKEMSLRHFNQVKIIKYPALFKNNTFFI